MSGGGGRLRIFVGPVEVNGKTAALSAALRAKGYRVTNHVVHKNLRMHDTNDESTLLRLAGLSDVSESTTTRGSLGRRTLTLFQKSFFRFAWSLAVAFSNDVFFFHYGISLWPHNLDLFWLRLLRKRIIIWGGQGGDMRPLYLSGPAIQDEELSSRIIDEWATDSRRKKRKADRWSRHSNVVVNHPGQHHFFSKPFVDIDFLYPPRKTSVFKQLSERNHSLDAPDQRVKLLHAPSRVADKGTVEIRLIVQRLIQDGFPLKYEEISGRPNRDVLLAMLRCNLFLDQVWSDLPISAAGVEAGLLGKPVLCAGYGNLVWSQPEKGHDAIPVFFCQPEQLESTLRKLVSDRLGLRNAGKMLQEHLMAKLSEPALAKRYERLITGEIPEDWIVDPLKFTYLEGYGQPRKISARNVRYLLSRKGVSGLGVKHNPELEAALVAFAGLYRDSSGRNLEDGER